MYNAEFANMEASSNNLQLETMNQYETDYIKKIVYTFCSKFAVRTWVAFTPVPPNFIFARSSIDTWVTETLYDVFIAKYTIESFQAATGLVPASSSILTRSHGWTIWIVLSTEVPFLAVCSFVSVIADFLTSVIVTRVMSFTCVGWETAGNLGCRNHCGYWLRGSFNCSLCCCRDSFSGWHNARCFIRVLTIDTIKA